MNTISPCDRYEKDIFLNMKPMIALMHLKTHARGQTDINTRGQTDTYRIDVTRAAGGGYIECL